MKTAPAELALLVRLIYGPISTFLIDMIESVFDICNFSISKLAVPFLNDPFSKRAQPDG
jgi:hypothetical protein